MAISAPLRQTEQRVQDMAALLDTVRGRGIAVAGSASPVASELSSAIDELSTQVENLWEEVSAVRRALEKQGLM